jgi:hypothetical protein
MMHTLIPLLLLAVFGAVTFFLARQGLWTALVTLPSVLVAATLATAWHGWVAAQLGEFLPSHANLFDLVSIYLLFVIVFGLMREFTDRASRTRIPFPKRLDQFGAPVAAMLVGWTVMAFVAASLHVAAVRRDDVQPTPEARMLGWLSPDRAWLQWVRGSSLHGPFGNPAAPFDEHADFLVRYAARRYGIESAAAPAAAPPAAPAGGGP